MRVPGHSIGTVDTRASETARRDVGQASEAASTTGTQGTQAVVDGSRSQEVRASAERAEAARSEKLERIAAALSDGTYTVDFQAVAEKLVDDELSRSGQ